MTLKEEIASIQAKITKAEAERDTWRTSGLQEKYLEACSMVDALEVQLERLRQAGLRSSLRPFEPLPAPLPWPIASGANERESVMAEFSISYNGRHYQFDRFRYDSLGDALAYARLQRSRPGGEGVEAMPAAQMLEAPDESERRLMASLAITFEGGVYHLGSFRYDRLADAVNYARLQLPEQS
jgi:hypothetical protein